MSLIIYGKPASRAFRVLWTAEELEIPYESRAYDFGGPEIGSPAFLAINPNGLIPAIEDNGMPMFESLAINLYLARKHAKLWPTDLRGEAAMLQWTLWAATEAEPILGRWYYHAHALPVADRRAEVASEAAEKLARKLDVLDGALAKVPWLAGDLFTVADLNLAAVLYRGPLFGLERWLKISDWHRRCYERPAARRAVAMREGTRA
jgi:glutathione S-transferase